MLEAIGLTDNDERVYHALVRRAHGTAADLAADCQLTAPVVRGGLTRLVDHGLASRSGTRPVRFAAVEPDSAVESILRDREKALHDVRSHVHTLMRMYRAGTRFAHPEELIEVVSDRDEVNRRWVLMQQSTKVEMRGFDRPPYAAPQAHRTSNPVELDLLERGVRYRVVYDKSVLELPGWLDDVSVGMRHGEQARISVGLPMKLAISDDQLAIIPLLRAGDDAVTASYFIHPSPLLDAVVALFEAVWDRSVPVRLTEPHGTDEVPDGLGEDEARLLMLLASGATDKAASRALGWSERTVQRRVNRLMARLGAQTRFQVAMEATRRGWV